MAIAMPIETPPPSEDATRQRTIKMRNRALLIVLVTLVALFYALAIVRMSGG